MPGILVVTKQGQKTYTPASGQAVTGGRVVEAVAPGRIQHAGAGSIKTLGVAIADAVAPEQLNLAPTTDSYGRPVLNLGPPVTVVTVVSAGQEVPVAYAADAAFGDRLITAADGKVTPAGANPDFRTVVGKCTEPGGVTVAIKATGLMQTA